MNDFSLTNMAIELLHINEDIPFRFKNKNTKISDFELYDFTQMWGSTSLGFSGIGGQAMTFARTYVFVPIECEEDCFIYFAGKFAYSVPYSKLLMEDIENKSVKPQYSCTNYIKHE